MSQYNLILNHSAPARKKSSDEWEEMSDTEEEEAPEKMDTRSYAAPEMGARKDEETPEMSFGAGRHSEVGTRRSSNQDSGNQLRRRTEARSGSAASEKDGE